MTFETPPLVVARNPAVQHVETIQLAYRGLYCLPYGEWIIRVLQGRALVAAQTQDHLLKAGDSLHLPRQPHAVLVSALAQQQLCFEIHKCCARPSPAAAL